MSGVCASIAGPACTTLPTVQDASTDTCFVGTASGAACIPVCNPGFKGQILVRYSNNSLTLIRLLALLVPGRLPDLA